MVGHNLNTQRHATNPYETWQKTHSVDKNKVEVPIKQSSVIMQNMEQIKGFSPDYNLKKLNNYDNTVKNVSRHVFEKYDLGKLYGRRSDFGTMKSDPSEALKEGRSASIGSTSMGTGARAFLYTAVPKAGA